MKIYGVPIIGTVGEGGKIDLTPEGEALLSGPSDAATRLEEYADALGAAAESIKEMVTPLPNHLACTGLVAVQDLITASIRLYGIACEMRHGL